jgi:hypothetical protein
MANALLELEELLALLLDEHAAEHVAEQPDVRAECALAGDVPRPRRAQSLGILSPDTGVKTPSPNFTITSPLIGN